MLMSIDATNDVWMLFFYQVSFYWCGKFFIVVIYLVCKDVIEFVFGSQLMLTYERVVIIIYIIWDIFFI